MSDFAHSLTIKAPIRTVHDAVARHANRWWSTNAVISDREGGYNEFRFPAAQFHAAFRVTKNSPTLVEWFCVDSMHAKSSGYKDLREWVGTTVRFELESIGAEETRLSFRHAGLVESMECFGSCSNIWGFYLQSLRKLVETGEGDPFVGGKPGSQSAGLVAIMIPFDVKPGRLEAAQAAIREFVASIEKNEPDTILYRSYQGANDPAHFVHYMLFKDDAAHVKHRDSDYCAHFVKTLYPNCERNAVPTYLKLFDEAASAPDRSAAVDIRTVVQEFVEEYKNRHNPDIVDKLVAEDCKIHIPLPGLPQGREGMRLNGQLVCGAFPDVSVERKFFVVEGDIVVERAHAFATHRGEIVGVPATNKKVTWTELHAYRVEDGLITEIWSEADF